LQHAKPECRAADAAAGETEGRSFLTAFVKSLVKVFYQLVVDPPRALILIMYAPILILEWRVFCLYLLTLYFYLLAHFLDCPFAHFIRAFAHLVRLVARRVSLLARTIRAPLAQFL
jgi:hypothetical protein